MGRARKLVAAAGLTVGLLSVPAVAGAGERLTPPDEVHMENWFGSHEHRDFPSRPAFEVACIEATGRVVRMGPERLVCDYNHGFWGRFVYWALFLWDSPLAADGAVQPEPGFW